MSDIRTALDIIRDENEILIEAFVDMKNKELLTQKKDTCFFTKPCIKCRCLWCTMALPLLRLDLNSLHRQLHNECYYKVLKEWIP